LECMGLTSPSDVALTPEACAIACCATTGCEVYQFTNNLQDYNRHCWIGALDQGGHSCIPSPGNFVGGGRPSPNQMFSLMTDQGALQSSLVDKTDPDSATLMCVHVRPTTPQALVVPSGTLVGLEDCDGLTNQQLAYDPTNGTIFLFDGVAGARQQSACLDGTAKGPGSGENRMLQMWQCYTDPSNLPNKARAKEHQRWEYDTSISKKVKECSSSFRCVGLRCVRYDVSGYDISVTICPLQRVRTWDLESGLCFLAHHLHPPPPPPSSPPPRNTPQLYLPGVIGKSCSFENGVYYGGPSLDDGPFCVMNQDECCQECEMNLNCTHFNFNTVPVHACEFAPPIGSR
jgi:hypothetical protein